MKIQINKNPLIRKLRKIDLFNKYKVMELESFLREAAEERDCEVEKAHGKYAPLMLALNDLGRQFGIVFRNQDSKVLLATFKDWLRRHDNFMLQNTIQALHEEKYRRKTLEEQVNHLIDYSLVGEYKKKLDDTREEITELKETIDVLTKEYAAEKVKPSYLSMEQIRFDIRHQDSDYLQTYENDRGCIEILEMDKITINGLSFSNPEKILIGHPKWDNEKRHPFIVLKYQNAGDIGFPLSDVEHLCVENKDVEALESPGCYVEF